MTWVFQDEPVTTLPENTFGFVYKLTYKGGFFYVGYKQVASTKLLPALKSGKLRDNANRVYRIIRRDEKGNIITAKKQRKGVKGSKEAYDEVPHLLPWKDYESSSEVVKDYELLKKEILEFLPTKRSLTYAEVKWQFKLDVLENPNALNENISGRWFKGNLL
jgi:hypothetical protein